MITQLLASAFFLLTFTTAFSQTEDRRSRQVSSIPAGDVLVTINEQLLNAVLDGLFTFTKPPSYQINKKLAVHRAGKAKQQASYTQNQTCGSEIILAREVGGVRTRVRFENGRIAAPVAFRGSYDSGSLLGCFQFEGWADTEINISFDQTQQALKALIRVRNVSIEGLPTLLRGSMTNMVQNAIDARVNPLELLRTEQLSARVPITRNKNGEALRLRAREVSSEVLENEVRLRISYEITKAN